MLYTKRVSILLCILFFFPLVSWCQAEKAQAGTILVYPLPESVSEKETRYSAYAFVDVYGNYEDYYKTYKDNTSRLEDDYFKRKDVISETETTASYHLVFRQWIVGELFKLREDHEKVESGGLEIITRSLVFPGQKRAAFWKVKKYLVPETKNSWVGDRFRYLDIYIAFIKMGDRQTRIFYRMTLDAEERRSTEIVQNEAKSGIANILDLYKQPKD